MLRVIATLIVLLLGNLPNLAAACSSTAADCCATATPCADCSCAWETETNPPTAVQPPVTLPNARDAGRAAFAVSLGTPALPPPTARLADWLPPPRDSAPPLFLQTHAFLI